MRQNASSDSTSWLALGTKRCSKVKNSTRATKWNTGCKHHGRERSRAAIGFAGLRRGNPVNQPDQRRKELMQSWAKKVPYFCCKFKILQRERLIDYTVRNQTSLLLAPSGANTILLDSLWLATCWWPHHARDKPRRITPRPARRRKAPMLKPQKQ